MKAKITASLACLCLLLTACNDVSLLSYDMDFATAELTISATTNPDTSYVLISPPINAQLELDANGVDPDLIKEASIQSINIMLKSPLTGNFDWAESASVVIKASGQPDEIIAEIPNVDPGLNELSANIIGGDLTAYLKGGEFILELRADNDEVIPVDHLVEVTLAVEVRI